MRKLTNEPTISIDNLELPIFTQKNGVKFYCYVEPLVRFKREIDAMLSHHDKIFILRFDVRVHTYSETNEVMTTFCRSYLERVKRYYKTKNIAYVWCREVETAKKQHYHFAIMVDANKTRVAGALKDIANEVASIQDLSLWHCKNPSYLIKRKDLANDDYSDYNEAFFRLSYLTKERGKKIKAERANSYQTSRIKPRLNEFGKIFSPKDDYKQYLKAKADANKRKRIAKPASTNLTEKPVHLMTDAERQLPLF